MFSANASDDRKQRVVRLLLRCGVRVLRTFLRVHCIVKAVLFRCIGEKEGIRRALRRHKGQSRNENTRSKGNKMGAGVYLSVRSTSFNLMVRREPKQRDERNGPLKKLFQCWKLQNEVKFEEEYAL